MTDHPTPVAEPPRYLPWLLLLLSAALAAWAGARVPVPVGRTPHALVSTLGSGARDKVLHDLNGDGYLDLAIAEGDPGRMPGDENQDSLVCSIWLGDAAGHLRRHALLYGGRTTVLAGLDVDQDGDLDLLAASAEGSSSALLLNDGHANFRPGKPLDMISPDNLTMGDMDGDDAPDLVAQGLGHAVGVWHNDGRGHFQFQNVEIKDDLSQDSASWPFRPLWVALADVDRDGDADVVTVSGPGDDLDGNQLLRLLLNDGHGQLTSKAQLAVPHLTHRIAIGDLNGDGWPDLLLEQNRGNSPALLHVLLNDGYGRYGVAPKLTNRPYAGPLWEPVTLGQELDMVVSQTQPGMSDFSQVALGDVDHDGDLDLVVASQFGCCMRVRRNDGHAHFAAPYAVTADTVFDKGDLAIGDFDGDGRLEWLAPQQHPETDRPPALGDRAFLYKLR